ncbi:hypothetical protein [Solemya velum gill symbiont]|nr:hypothetical protein [Solemya velum gill symbiont]
MMQDPLKTLCEDPLERRWVWMSLFLAVLVGFVLGLYALSSYSSSQ